MIEFKKTEGGYSVYQVAPHYEDLLLGEIFEGEFCIDGIDSTIYPEDLRQIADKLEELNGTP